MAKPWLPTQAKPCWLALSQWCELYGLDAGAEDDEGNLVLAFEAVWDVPGAFGALHDLTDYTCHHDRKAGIIRLRPVPPTLA